MNPLVVSSIYGAALLGAPIAFLVYLYSTKDSSKQTPDIKLENNGRPIEGGVKHIKIVCE